MAYTETEDTRQYVHSVTEYWRRRGVTVNVKFDTRTGEIVSDLERGLPRGRKVPDVSVRL